VFPGAQVPHEVIVRERPQRSTVVKAPQLRPLFVHSSASVSGTQAQVPLWQLFGAVQTPHEAIVR
jgi:hypothetical protein